MATFLLILSSVLFIATFGIHSTIKTSQSFDQPMYVNNPLLTAIPWISGFILSFVALNSLLDIHWILVFIGNAIVVFILGPFLTRQFLVRFASGDGLGKDMVISFIGGLISFIIGLIIQ